MKPLTIIIIGLLFALNCPAATHYVVPPGTAGANPADPYTNWATAGTNILEVVNAALTNSSSRLVWVTNGTYYLTNQISITNVLTLQSVNGRNVTVVNGARRDHRCISISTANSLIDGFTITEFCPTTTDGNGIVYLSASSSMLNCLLTVNSNLYASAQGIIRVAGSSTTVTISNCYVINNYAAYIGGGIQVDNAVVKATITASRFEGNYVNVWSGAGVDVRSKEGVVSNCVIVNNSAKTSGGGIFSYLSTTNLLVVNCTITGNVIRGAGGNGGGISGSAKMTIQNCSILGNTVPNLGGGFYGTNMTIRNCLIARNQSTTNSGGGIWMTNGSVENCTIVSNCAGVAGGGLYISGSGGGTNNIIYFNTAPAAANFTNTEGNAGLSYSCVIPAVAGAGNITNNPILKDFVGGDYRLRVTSPCVNAGTNQPWMTNAVDLDGNARILKTIVDMGAYETRIWQGTIFSVPGR